jgi:hypothetical protein
VSALRRDIEERFGDDLTYSAVEVPRGPVYVYVTRSNRARTDCGVWSYSANAECKFQPVDLDEYQDAVREIALLRKIKERFLRHGVHVKTSKGDYVLEYVTGSSSWLKVDLGDGAQRQHFDIDELESIDPKIFKRAQRVVR